MLTRDWCLSETIESINVYTSNPEVNIMGDSQYLRKDQVIKLVQESNIKVNE